MKLIMMLLVAFSFFSNITNVYGVEVCLSSNSTIQEEQAAKELCFYIKNMTGTAAQITRGEKTSKEPTIFVGLNAIADNAGLETKSFKSDEWHIKSIPDGLLLLGEGTRGTLYATYHYLEDVCGVRWWNPWETFVPQLESLQLEELNLSGVPTFRFRDIHALYGQNEGHFSSHLRLNRDGHYPIANIYGGSSIIGPPYQCHTLGKYIPSSKYFKTHPEWFALRNGKRCAKDSQLCLSNPELRKEVIKRLRDYIKLGEDRAKKANKIPPIIYDISQSDNQNYCNCPKCQAIAKREGSQAGLLLDFINEIANAIKKDYPNIYINTFAYQYTEKTPKTIRPAKNVIITLCDTLSNETFPISPEQNAYFYKRLKEWSAIAPQLRIWDYAITFQKPKGLPFPSVDTYASDTRLFADSGVFYIFCELEEPILADVRDYKVWMLAKMYENANASSEKLAKDFTDGFYGPAGKLFRKYRACLRKSQNGKNAFIGMYSSAAAFSFLDCATLVDCQKIFKEGEMLLSGNEKLLRRWNFAFLSLHRAICIRKRSLLGEWYRDHKTLKEFPFDIKDCMERIRKTWTEQAQIRLAGEELKKSLALMEKELKEYAEPVSEKSLSVPKKFQNLPREQVFDFFMTSATRWSDVVKLIEDPEAESGMACRLGFPNEGGEKHCVEKYKLPLKCGVYSPGIQSSLCGGEIKANQVPGPGYHWYKLRTSFITADSYLWVFWSWRIKLDISKAFNINFPKQKFDIWARVKFTGPAFPKGVKTDPNAIYLERVILVKVAPAVEPTNKKYSDDFSTTKWSSWQTKAAKGKFLHNITDGHSMNGCMEIVSEKTNPKKSSFSFLKRFPVIQGKTYRASVWVKVLKTNADSKFSLTFRGQDKGKHYLSVPIKSIKLAGDKTTKDWEHLVLTFTIPTTGNWSKANYLLCMISMSNTDEGRVLFDDFCFLTNEEEK